MRYHGKMLAVFSVCPLLDWGYKSERSALPRRNAAIASRFTGYQARLLRGDFKAQLCQDFCTNQIHLPCKTKKTWPRLSVCLRPDSSIKGCHFPCREMRRFSTHPLPDSHEKPSTRCCRGGMRRLPADLLAIRPKGGSARYQRRLAAHYRVQAAKPGQLRFARAKFWRASGARFA